MRYWEHQKQLLKNRSFQFYLLSSIAGTFASGLAYIVIIWLVVSFHPTLNATLIGMILFWVPSLILSPYFGSIVDQYDRKKLIIIAESIRSIMFIVFGLFLLYQPDLWIVYLLLILSGCFAAFYQPLAPAFVHELVPMEQLVYANTNINMAYEFGNIIGRGIITVIALTFLGTYGALFLVGILYFISTITIIPIQRHHTIEPINSSKNISLIQNIIDGYRYLFSNKELLSYGFVQAVILIGLMAAPVLVGPYVKIVLHAGNRIFGISEAAISLGAIAGAFFWSYIANHVSNKICLVFASILASLSYLTLANTINITYSLAAFLLLGFSWGSFSLIMSLVQTLTDKNYQGRVQASISMAVTIIFILFSVFLHIFDKNYNAQSAFMLLAFLCIFVFVGIITAQKFKKT